MDICIEPRVLSGTIRAISSKSDVHRLMIGAALAKGTSHIRFTTLSEDIAATIGATRMMGATLTLDGSDGNYDLAVTGLSKTPRGAVLYAHECGTTARLLLPVAATLCDSFTMTGSVGLAKRPFKELCDCMAQNGSTCSSDFLPIKTSGRLCGGIYKIRGDISSQYISGLLFALPLLESDSEIRLTTPLVSAGYIDMTLRTLARFNIKVEKTSFGFRVRGNQTYRPLSEIYAEGDWSNATFWLAAGAIGEKLTVSGLDKNSLQKDKDVLDILQKAGTTVRGDTDIAVENTALRGTNLCGEDIPDALPALATVLALANGKSIITGGSRLRIKESDRIKTTVEMLKTLGADIEGTDDGFIINGVNSFTGGTVDAANDHRIAMCAAIASQRASGDVIIKGAECVNKSYPTFFEDFKKLGGKYSVIIG